MSSTKTANKYRPIFQRYLRGALKQSLNQVREHRYTLSEDVRVQACHVLTLALDIEKLWKQSSKLLIELSPKMHISGNWEIWIPFLSKGLCVSLSLKDNHVRARLCLELGSIRLRQSCYSEAQELLAESKKLYSQLNQADDMGLVLNQLALNEMVQKQYRKAQKLAENALTLFGPEHPERANSYFVLGTTNRELGKLDIAKNYFEHAVNIRRIQENYVKMASGLIGLAIIERHKKNHKSEVVYLTEALKLLEKGDSVIQMADVQNNLGIAYSLNGNSWKAIELFHNAAKTFHTTADLGNLASVHTNLGIDYTILEEWDLGKQFLQSSIAIFQQSGDLQSEINAKIELANLYHKQESWQAAYDCLQSASEQLKGIVDSPLYHQLNEKISSQIKLSTTECAL